LSADQLTDLIKIAQEKMVDNCSKKVDSNKASVSKVKLSENPEVRNAFSKAVKICEEKIREFHSKPLQSVYDVVKPAIDISVNRSKLLNDIKELEGVMKNANTFEPFVFYITTASEGTFKKVDGGETAEEDVLLWDDDKKQLFFIRRQYPFVGNENEIEYDWNGHIVNFSESAKYHVVMEVPLAEAPFEIQKYSSGYLEKFLSSFADKYSVYDQLEGKVEVVDDEIPF
jgi:hypothetical protein